MVDGTFGLTVSIADRMATRTSGRPIACARSIAFCRMSTLSSSVGAMLTAASVMISASRVIRHVHHEAVADAPRGAQARIALDHRGHQLVGVQAALHQGLGLALAHQLHRRRGGRLAVGRIDDLDAGQIDACSSAATARMRSRGPTRIGAIRPSLAASIAPSSEDASQGCATAVGVGGIDLQCVDQPLVLFVLSQSCHSFCLAPVAGRRAQARRAHGAGRRLAPGWPEPCGCGASIATWAAVGAVAWTRLSASSLSSSVTSRSRSACSSSSRGKVSIARSGS